jgi:hypothetical protein
MEDFTPPKRLPMPYNVECGLAGGIKPAVLPITTYSGDANFLRYGLVNLSINHV